MKKQLGLLLVAALVGCGKKSTTENSNSVNSENAVVETSVGAVSAMGDEQSGDSYLALGNLSKPQDMYATVENLLLPRAQAQALCNRAVFATCSSGVRQADYTNCEPGSSNAVLNGSVTLTYSQSACTMASNGDTVTRTMDLNFSGPHGGTAQVSSAVASDYRSTSYGGGGRLTKTASGYGVDILGKHIALDWRGIHLFNISLRTLSSLGITGTLARSGRVVDGGQLEVNHNLAGFTAVIQPHSLHWQAGCCYPVSGSLDVTYSGSKTGNATVTFLGCGTAIHDNGTVQRTMSLSYCE